MIMTPITAAELAAVEEKHRQHQHHLRARGCPPPFGRHEICDALIDHWIAVRDEIDRQEKLA